MLPLKADINIFKVGLLAKCEALSDVADGHDHVLVLGDALDVFDIGIDQFFIQFYILQPRRHIHDVKHAVRYIVIYK